MPDEVRLPVVDFRTLVAAIFALTTTGLFARRFGAFAITVTSAAGACTRVDETNTNDTMLLLAHMSLARSR